MPHRCRAAIFIVVEGRHGEAVMAWSLGDSAGSTYIRKAAAAFIVEEEGWSNSQAHADRTSRRALPHAAALLARNRSFLQIEVHVVGDDKIELAVAVVVDKSATGAPLLSTAGYASRGRDFAEGAIALIVVEAIGANRRLRIDHHNHRCHSRRRTRPGPSRSR